jgi:predicted anti-sigma-YlaC factor YlaD
MNWKAYLSSFVIWAHSALALVVGTIVAAGSQYLQTGGAIPTTQAQWNAAISTVLATALTLMAAHLKQSPLAPNQPAPPIISAPLSK